METLSDGTENRIASLVAPTGFGMVCWNSREIIIDANDAFSRLIGYPRQALVSDNVRLVDLTSPEYRFVHERAMEECAQFGYSLPYLIELAGKNGENVKALIGGVFSTGSQERTVAFVVDLSERESLQELLRRSEESRRIISDGASDAIVVFNEEGIITYANAAVQKVFGYLPEEVSGQPISLLITNSQEAYHVAALMRDMADAGPQHFWNEIEVSALNKEGERILVEISIGKFQTPDSCFFTGIMRDITERKKSQEMCLGQNRLLEMVAVGEPLTQVLDHLVWLIESQCPGMLGSVLLLTDGVHVRHASAPNLPAEYVRAVNGAEIGPEAGSCGTAMYWHKPVIVADIQEDYRWANYRQFTIPHGLRACWSTPIYSSKGGVTGSFAMYYRQPRRPNRSELQLADIASHIAGIAIERYNNENRISYMAHHDALTGLPNRILLQSTLHQSLTQARRHRSLLALLFIDLDNFKHINDSLGHQIGDLLLQSVARRLQSCLRQDDIMARLGGDEFVVALGSLPDVNEAAVVAEKILKALETTFELEGHELHVSASIGVSVFPSDGQDVDTLMRSADTAMYHAKEKGRSNYQFFTPALNAKIQSRMAMENRIRHALSGGEFILHYQPQVDMKSGRIIAAEALIRWHRPDSGLVLPDQFIPIAEESGLILQVGEWVLREACEQLKRWHHAGYPNMKMAVNLSVRQIFHSSLAVLVEDILKENQLPPDSLDLEITESVLMPSNAENMAMLKRLNELGIHLCVDDFGIGYSSLSYLKRFPIHTLKIDQSFIAGIGIDQNDMAITDAIIGMAKGLHLSLIAEGVENAEQASYLKSRGCASAQGNYYGKPITSDALMKRLMSQSGFA